MPPTTVSYRTPVVGAADPPGLTFPADGSGLPFDAGYPLTFRPDAPLDVGVLFPTLIPHVERFVYSTVRDACSSRVIFPTDGSGLPLPAAFNVPPDISLYQGLDGTYTIDGKPVPPIPVVRGWPAYPGQVPAIGVAESTSSSDPAERTAQSGFAGDACLTDNLGNVIASCAYYSEPLYVTVVVELIHTNRDERDRLHDQLHRVLYPLRHVLPASDLQVKEVAVDSEKQDLPLDEQPTVMYVSVFTVQVAAEQLIPDEIVLAGGGVIQRIDTTVTPVDLPLPATADGYIDLT